MHASAEFITGTVFAAVMVIIGLGAIWIVRWQTYFLLRHQIQGPESHGAMTGASISLLESAELENLRQPSNRTSTIGHESCTDSGGANHAVEGRIEMVFSTPSCGPVTVRHMLSTSVLEYHGRNIETPSGRRTTTPSCNSTLNHEPSVEIIKDNHAAVERLPVSSGTTLAADTTKDLYVDEVSVKEPLRSPTETNQN